MEINKETSLGGLVISEEVIASIACNAAKDIDGVAGFASKPVDIKNVIKKASFASKASKSVRVYEDEEKDLNITIYVVLKGGAKIPVVAEAVQSSIKDAIQNMTGRVVSKVNVTIADVHFDLPVQPTEPSETQQ